MKIIESFIDKLSLYNNKISIIHSSRVILYSELVENILLYNSKLDKLKIKRGEVVFILGDYSFDSISLFFSLALNGNIIVPLTTENEQEIKERIQITQPDWIFKLSSNSENRIEYDVKLPRHVLLDSLIESQSSGLILFSSGSTGKPKAMVHNLENLLSNYIDKKGKEMNFLVFLMFDHIGGLNTLFNCLSMGVTITIPENRNPNDIAKLIAPELWKAHTDYIDETLIGLYKENLISVSYNENLEATFSATPEGLKRLKKHYGIVPERDSKDDNSWG